MITENTTVESLKNDIVRYNKSYRIGKPEISDLEFDNLLDNLRERIEQSEYDSFRKTLTEESGFINHTYKMGSLDKLKIGDKDFSVKSWIEKTVPDFGDGTEGLFISSKIDGCSACLNYVDGKLVSAATRGDGVVGVDITRKVKLFAPPVLEKSWTGYIRGEVTLTKQTLTELSELNKRTYKNLRNATAGLINAKDVSDEEVSMLRFFAYEVMGEYGTTKKEQFEKLENLGFDTALHIELTEIFKDFSEEDYDSSLQNIFNKFIGEAPFDIDGLVISGLHDDEVTEDEFIPKHTVAVKFNQMSAETQLIDISWEVSKNGTLHPTGIISPVELGGGTITNVTLNNIDYIRSNGFTYGCNVTVLKSGDIIPKITSVSHPNPQTEAPIEFPSICPSCGSNVVYEKDAIFPRCSNEHCKGMLVKKILHLLKNLDIKNVSTKSLHKFEIYSVNKLIHLQNNGGAKLAQFINDIDKILFGATKEELLCAFDYDGVSSAIIEKLLEHYGFDKLVDSDYETLKNDLPYGVGDEFLKKFCKGFANVRDDFYSIILDGRYHGNDKSAKVEKSSGVLNNCGFVVTGELRTMSRSAFKTKVIANGGIYQGSVSKKTAYLVCNDKGSGTTKIKKAESLGVKVIDENEFITMIDNPDGFSIF